MEQIKKTEILRVRITPNEKQILKKMAAQENTTMSNIIYDRIFSPKKKIVRKASSKPEFEKEQSRQKKIILGDMCSAVNQLKADVYREDAISKLEEGVESLCQLIK